MPPKRRGRQLLQKKKVQIIRTRLIEISIKVEDLVYQKKPISEVEAQMYINEVNSYQVECSQDERSLQVIEKLMRCMKAIIAEHKEERLHNDNMQCEGHQLCTGSSPVYSLPDEDRSQMSQELEVQIPDLNRGEETNMKDCCNNYLNETEFQQDTESYDLVSIENKNDRNSFVAPIETSKSLSPINVEISKALSSLSINDVYQDERMSTDIDCSQSILKNLDVLDNLDYNSNSNVEPRNRKIICGALQTIETKDTQTKLQDPVIEFPTSIAVATRSGSIIKSGNNEDKRKAAEGSNNNLNTTKQSIRTNLDNSYNYNKPSGNFNMISAHDDFNGRISTNALKEGTLIGIPVLFNKKIQSKSINVIKQTDPFVGHNNITNSGSNVKTILQENIPNTNSVITLKKKRKPRKKIVTGSKEGKDNMVPNTLVNNSDNAENKMIKPSKRRTNSKKTNKTAEKESSLPIYNKNVENDLSWLEGIRFVREIQEDECDSKFSNLNDDFWDNYYLPPNFDDADFL